MVARTRRAVLTQNKTMLQKFNQQPQTLTGSSPALTHLSECWKCCILIYSLVCLPSRASCDVLRGQGAGASSVVVTQTPKTAKELLWHGRSKYFKIWIVDRYFELQPCWYVQQQRLSILGGTKLILFLTVVTGVGGSEQAS